MGQIIDGRERAWSSRSDPYVNQNTLEVPSSEVPDPTEDLIFW